MEKSEEIFPYLMLGYNTVINHFYGRKFTMVLRAKLEKRIKEKEAEINILELRLREARAYLQATQDALRLLVKTHGEQKAIGVRPGSILDQAFNILKEANRPMKIMDLLNALGKEQTHENRQSLVGSVGAYARKGRLFTKTGPNTFGLLEWKRKKIDEENELPENFGLK